MGSQGGNPDLLYLTTTPENASWYAEEKEDGLVLEVTVPRAALRIDPEDGTGATVEEELDLPFRLPGSLATAFPLAAERFGLFTGPAPARNGLSVSVRVFEDHHPESGTERAWMPEALLGWFREAARRFSEVDLPAPNESLSRGELSEIELWLCSRETADEVFGQAGAMGFHQIETPDSDPFGDESASARAYRVFVVCDRDEMEAEIREARPYGPQEVLLTAGDWAATLHHELAHAALFAANANMNTPADIETLSDAGEIGNDLFDMSSGYGIRPLTISGRDVWAEDADHARDLMEAWCEERGREWLVRHSPGIREFLEAAGFDPDEDEPAEGVISGP